MKIKICHMTSVHNPEDNRIFSNECVSLAKAGYDVFLVAKGESYDKDGVHIVGIGEVLGGRLHRMYTVARQIYEKAVALNCDIYHFHDPELLRYGLKLKKNGKKVIFDSHENVADSILEKEWIPWSVRRIVFFSYSYYQKKVCSEIDAIICAADNLVPFFSQFNSRVISVANYPVYDDVDYQPPSFLKKNVVFAGGVSEQWNHEYIIQALLNIPFCAYNLCGPCSESYLQKLKKIKSWSQVNYYGVIPQSQVTDVLADSSIGLAILTPGLNTDGQNGNLSNTKIFEEMRAGLPVVCTNFVRWKEFVERYHCGICVNPHDIDEIANAIKFLLNNPAIAKEMGLNGRKAVRNEFNWTVQEKKLLNLYNKLINI